MTGLSSVHDFPAFSAVHFAVKGNHPEQVFKFLAWEMAKSSQLLAIEIVEHLEDYCKQHVAGIGDGVAVFDWKSPDITEPVLMLSRLEQPVAFTSLDDAPVDMIVTLISPEHTEQTRPLHLRHLARLSRFFRDTDLLQKLRDATCADGVRAVLATAIEAQPTVAPAFSQNIAA